MTVSYIHFTFKMIGVYWDPGFDPSNPWDVNTPDAAQFDERGYWYESGESDGRQLTGTKVDFIPGPFKYAYQNGYDDGVWKRKVFNQG